MGITHIPQQVASTVQDAAEGLKYQGNRLIDQGWEKNWVRTVAAGTLVTGAVVLATTPDGGTDVEASVVSDAFTAFSCA